MSQIKRISLYLLSIAGYILLGYYTQRENFYMLISIYFALFVIFFEVFRNCKTSKEIRKGIILAIVLRLVLIAAIPKLSDDYFRFIWDGQLICNGFSPYSYIPINFIKTYTLHDMPLAEYCFQNLNSLQLNNYSCYTPFNQVFFAFASFLFPDSLWGNIITLRLIIILAESGIIVWGIKVLKLLKLPVKNILLYALNPLIIIELTGNLHFEGIMIFFLIISLFYFYNTRKNISAGMLALSASVKLIPLIFLPSLIKPLKKSVFLYYILFACIFIILIFPIFLFNPPKNYFESISLWFNNFEFNASIYFLIRELGFLFKGYNIIQTAGPILSIISFISIIGISLLRKNARKELLAENMMFAVSIYLMLATTIHPWYISTLLALSVFSKYRYPLIWSLFIILSYSNYTSQLFSENHYLILSEYIIVFSYCLVELLPALRKKEYFYKT